MFGREKEYNQVLFPPEKIEEAINALLITLSKIEDVEYSTTFSYKSGESEQTTIRNSDTHQRFTGLQSDRFSFRLTCPQKGIYFSIFKNDYRMIVSIEDFPDIGDIERVLHVFDRNYEKYKVPTEEALKKISVFIGHGRNKLWRDLKDHLQDLHGIDVTAYETGARAGLTIHEILIDLSSSASIAFLVHTGEDIDKDGNAHARENVIHETGLFQGKLGFRRAIVLLEDGCNEFSNISGLQQLRFPKDNMKEIFGDVLAVLRREFTSTK